MGRKEKNIAQAQEIMSKPKFIRNIGIAAHIDHGKTTLSDNLIAGAGMMSEELAGKQLLLDFDEQEQDRGITINAANVSMVHKWKGDDYLINLVDTPGHVDFGGDVTRAMRAVDGCVIVVCAVEGVMPQTETVVRQALKERVRPTLFINKVDRLINELKVTEQQMQVQFINIIKDVNKLIAKNVPPEHKKDWVVKVEDGSVAFGSAYCNWAISIPYMKESGISFKEIYDYCAKKDQRALAKKAPVHEVLLDMIIKHLPSPFDAQKERIPNIWKGDLESEIGQALYHTKTDAETVFMVVKIFMDKHAGEIAIGRLFSGSVKKGDSLEVVGMPGAARIQRVGVFVGADRIDVPKVIAGNVVAVTGLRNAIAGSTVASRSDITPFERIVHVSEPVVTVAIEAKNMRDLPKLIEVLRTVEKADPSLKVSINQETGEHLLSGMGELHLEITDYRIVNEYGIPIISSDPIVVYRETVQKTSPNFEGKSPNKHNKFYIEAEPLEDEVYQAIKKGELEEGKLKSDVSKDLIKLGIPKLEAKGAYAVIGNNLLVNASRGVQYLHETKELIIEGFKEAITAGPLARETVDKVKIRLVDAKLHEDAIHRGPAQVIPAVRSAVYGALMCADAVITEPMMDVFITAPHDYMGKMTTELAQRRGNIKEMKSAGDQTTITCRAPIAEMFGFSSSVRGATQGRALWTTEFKGFSVLPRGMQAEVIESIRTRKGLKPQPPDASYYSA